MTAQSRDVGQILAWRAEWADQICLVEHRKIVYTDKVDGPPSSVALGVVVGFYCRLSSRYASLLVILVQVMLVDCSQQR